MRYEKILNGIFSSSCKFSGKIKSEAIKVVNDEDRIQKEFYEFLDRDIDRQIAQTAIHNRSKVKTFLIGSDYNKLNELDDVIQSYEEYVRELDDLLENDLEYKNIIEKNKNDVVEVKEETKLFVEKERGKFSLLGWLFN